MAKIHTPDTAPAYVWRSNQVHKFELDHYLKKRREANGVQSAPTLKTFPDFVFPVGGRPLSDPWTGYASGIHQNQKLQISGLPQYCFRRRLHQGLPVVAAQRRTYAATNPKENRNGEPIDNHNTKFDANAVGLQEHNSLFTRESYEYPNIETGKISTKHQLNHLRQHGEYLTPHRTSRMGRSPVAGPIWQQSWPM